MPGSRAARAWLPPVYCRARGSSSRSSPQCASAYGSRASGLISPDGAWVYVLDTHNQKIVRVSTARQKVEGELDSPDQRRLYVSCWHLSPSNITSY